MPLALSQLSRLASEIFLSSLLGTLCANKLRAIGALVFDDPSHPR